MEIRRFKVHGLVQGVFFRATTYEYVQENLGQVTGYVKNLPDRTVEVLAKGESSDLDQLEKFLHQGSPSSRVQKVDVTKVDHLDEEYSDFSIQR